MTIETGDIRIRPVLSSNNPLIISANNCNILVDTGRKSSWKSISDKLDSILGDEVLCLLIITHAHYDHVENAAAIKARYHAKIIAHKYEDGYLQRGESSPLPAWKYSVGEKINQQDEYKKYYTPVACDICVEDYLELNAFELNAYIIHTPGHTKGSITVVVNGSVAITGDTALEVAKRPFQRKPRRATAEVLDSWQRLIALNCKQYVTAHNGTMGHNDVVNNLISYKMLME